MKKLKLFWYILIIIPIILIALGYIFPSSFFSSQDKIRDYVLGFGYFAPLAFIIIQILQVILTPISHYAVGLAGGFVFGLWYGFILNYIGRVIGHSAAFYIGRKYGRKIFSKAVKKENLQKYDKIFDKGIFVLFLMYFLPLFPDDELSYLAGISPIKSKVFFPIMVLGQIGGSLGLAILGSGLSYKHPIFIIGSIITIILGISFIFYYKNINKY
jgi:uncharacterized membrane protein YdjX (TVP38/TMEM64 family)